MTRHIYITWTETTVEPVQEYVGGGITATRAGGETKRTRRAHWSEYSLRQLAKAREYVAALKADGDARADLKVKVQ